MHANKVDEIDTCRQFHQHSMYEFFNTNVVFLHTCNKEKAAETTFLQKPCAYNVDEIDTWCYYETIAKSGNISKYKCTHPKEGVIWDWNTS